MNRLILLIAGWVALASVAWADEPKSPPPAKLSARIVLAADSVTPGSTTPIAVELDLSKPWHMYHPILLDTGLPTTLRFIGPAEARVENLRYPTPTLGNLQSIEYLEFEGKFTIVGDLVIDAKAKPGSPLELAVKVDGLACVEACVPIDATAKASVPVSASAGSPKNDDFFKAAREALPSPLADAPHLKGSSVSVTKDSLMVGDKAEIIFKLKVEDGHHIQDRNPGVDAFIPTRVFIESVSGLKIAEGKDQVWPEPKIVDVPGVGKVRELHGEITIRVPIELTDKDFAGGPLTLRALVSYQCCKDGGVCYPPEMAEAAIKLVADTNNAPDERRAIYVVGDASKIAAGATATATSDDNASPAATATGGGDAAGGITFWGALFAALLGGLILNVMPCVLPVLSIKIVSFVQQSHEDPRRLKRLGFAFTLGVLSWFWVLALITGAGSAALREQFSNPLQDTNVTLAIGTVVLVMAFNLFGIFELMLPGAATGKLDAVAQREGYLGAFFKGFLATLLGTACTAPFLVAGIGYAITQPLAISFVVFTAAGVGMASPYLLLSLNPKWLKFVPKPGKWMETFKQAMGFTLVATAVWLLWVLRKPMGQDGLIAVVAFWSFVGLACWMLGRVRFNWKTSSAMTMWAASLGTAIAGYSFSFNWLYDPNAVRHERGAELALDDDAVLHKIAAEVSTSDWKRIPWQSYQPGLAEALSKHGYTVYVDYTADWCSTCKANLNFVLETDMIRKLMREKGVIPIEADFTGKDPAIRKDLNRFGHQSVPLNLIYPAKRPQDVIKLGVTLTQSSVEAELNRAGPSTAEPKVTAAKP